MKAYRLTKWGADGTLTDVPTPEPGPGQVLLKVAGNGLCHSDLHAMETLKEAPPHLDIELPITMGHEVAGWVEALGPGVTGLETGQPCLLTIAACGRCARCAEGWNNYCSNLGPQVGMGLDGGLAEYVAAPVGAGVPIRSEAELWTLAPLTDAGLSAYHAVNRAAHLLRPGSSALVIGAGGLGHMAVEIIRETTAARIIVADPSEAARTLAAERGADLCLPSDETTAASVREAVPGGRVDAVLDFVGNAATQALACAAVRPMGLIVFVGRGGGGMPLRHDSMPFGASICTTFGGSRLELMEVIALADAGRLGSHVSRYGLDQVQLAVEDLRAGGVAGRIVVVPTSR